YLITVKNLADGDFLGSALLIDQNLDSEATNPSPPALTRAPRLTGTQPSAGQSAYQVHLTVPSRTSRTVAVLAPDFFNVIQAEMGGRVLDTQLVEHPTVIPVAVLSEVETAASAVQALHFDRFTPRAVAFNTAAGFPSNPLLLAGYTAVVIDRFDSASLSG